MTTLSVRTARRPAGFTGILCAALALACFAATTRAEEEEEQAKWKGTIRGQVVDSERGTPVAYATVTLIWPRPADGSEARREQQVSDPNGGFEFASVPAGVYTLEFSKTGYQTSTLIEFAVTPERLDRADFQLPPESEPAPGAAPSAKPDEPLEDTGDFEEFVVLGARVEALEASRAESDELINTLSAEEFSKFAASDVAEALKFVAGVNVVEGQFAIIRGLEDRYSSTLYNSAPIPSPDPDRQSVQLDLFAADIVSNLVVAKTFGPDLPSNSSAGSINILTHDYPEDFEMKIQAGSGFNQNAIQRFLAFNQGSAFGTEEDGIDTIESDIGGSLGGRFEVFGREVRFKGVAANEIDYYTADGFLEGNQPKPGDLAFGALSLSDGGFDQTVSERTEQRTYYGGIGFDLDPKGNHRIDGSIFYTDKQNQAVDLRENGFLPGFDYSPLIQYYQDNGNQNPNLYLPMTPANPAGGCLQAVCASFDAWPALGIRSGEPEEITFPRQGALWFSNFSNSRSFDFQRDLTVYQINGDHRFDWLDGFHLSYALNKAKTTQQEQALAARFSFEPDDEHAPGFVAPTRFPVTIEALEDAIAAATQPVVGTFWSRAGGLVQNENDVSEKGWFGRLDGEYELQLFDPLLLRINSGIWYEDAKRDVSSLFRDAPIVAGSGTNWATGAPTREILGELVFQTLEPSGLRTSTNDSEREIKAWNGGLKATLWQDLDVLGGLRIEDIHITTNNDPFTGSTIFSGPATFPNTYLFLDRFDNPLRGEPVLTTFNDQVLGLDLPAGPCFAPGGAIPDPAARCVDLWNPADPTDRSAVEELVNGEIDELEYLPAVGLAYRPLEGMALRAAWSRTVARPSFREMGFYASSELGSDDLIVGNPQLQLSEVESWDARIEQVWGETGGFGIFAPGDLVAFSAFYKTIQNPIESVIVRDPVVLEGNTAIWRTFFNNENEATLWGIEVEARKSLGFLGPELAEYFSIGGNFTYIDAQVDRSEIEIARAQPFFGAPDQLAPYQSLNQSRRLFGQPEWIANTDISFQHPDWGTRITLVFFAISDLLDAAGNVNLRPDNVVTAYTLDRYIDSYYTLDLVASETLPFDVPLEPIGLEGTIPSALTFKVSIKNLTDSTRGIVYDRAQTSDEFAERRFKIGRDYSFSLTYSFAF